MSGIEIRYLGTAMIELRIGDVRFLTDPVLDPRGTTYDLGMWFTPRSWFSSEKQYDTPPIDGAFDAVLLSHDQHADNLDIAGRALIADEQRVARVITTNAAAKRLARARSTVDAPGKGLDLGSRVEGLAPSATTRVGNVTVTAMVARHGPSYAPQVHQVIGFVLDVDDGPRLWISGDTVLFPALAQSLEALAKKRPVDVAAVQSRSRRRSALATRGSRSTRPRQRKRRSSSARARSSPCIARAGRTSASRRKHSARASRTSASACV